MTWCVARYATVGELKKLLKDPLLHFLGLGLGLYVLFQLTGEQAENEVLVDREALLTFLQYQSVAFDREQFELFLNGMSPGEIADLIEEAAREEILYREALALGLDRDDYIIRSRLVQKLRYLAEGFASDAGSLDEESVFAYFEANRASYLFDPNITFTHVFFNAERRGWDEARALAEAKLRELNDAAVAFEDSPGHGDRFPYFVNYVARPPQLVASHLGAGVSDALFGFPADPAQWRGPFESRFGTHLVLIADRQPRRMPEFAEVRGRVAADAEAAHARERTEAAIDEIVAGYRVIVGADMESLPEGAVSTP